MGCPASPLSVVKLLLQDFVVLFLSAQVFQYGIDLEGILLLIGQADQCLTLMVLHFLQQRVLFCKLGNPLFGNTQLLLEHCNSPVAGWNVGLVCIRVLHSSEGARHTWFLCLDATCDLYLVVYDLLTQSLYFGIFLVNDLLQLSVDVDLFLHLCSILV